MSSKKFRKKFRDRSQGVRQECGDGFSVEMGLDDLDEVVEGGAALGGTGSDDRPDAFGPFPSTFAARPLCDVAVYRHKPDRLFGQVVGRFDARCGDELEVRATMVA